MNKTPNNYKLVEKRDFSDLFDSNHLYVNLKRTKKHSDFKKNDIFIRLKYFHTALLKLPKKQPEISSVIKNNTIIVYVLSDLKGTRKTEDQQVMNLYLHVNKKVAKKNNGRLTVIFQDENEGTQKSFILQLPDSKPNAADKLVEVNTLPKNFNANLVSYSSGRPDDDIFNGYKSDSEQHEYLYHSLIKQRDKTLIKVKFFHCLKEFKLHDPREIDDIDSESPKTKIEILCPDLRSDLSRNNQQVSSSNFIVKGKSSGKTLTYQYVPEHKSICPSISESEIRIYAITHECDIIIPKL